MVCWSFGSGSWGWFQRSIRDFGGWWNCFILWVWWWLYNCMHLSKPTELCHEKFLLIICKCYLGNVWDLCHRCNILRIWGLWLSIQALFIFLLACMLETFFIHNLFLRKHKFYFYTYQWLYVSLLISQSGKQSFEIDLVILNFLIKKPSLMLSSNNLPVLTQVVKW